MASYFTFFFFWVTWKMFEVLYLGLNLSWKEVKFHLFVYIIYYCRLLDLKEMFAKEKMRSELWNRLLGILASLIFLWMLLPAISLCQLRIYPPMVFEQVLFSHAFFYMYILHFWLLSEKCSASIDFWIDCFLLLNIDLCSGRNRLCWHFYDVPWSIEVS